MDNNLDLIERLKKLEYQNEMMKTGFDIRMSIFSSILLMFLLMHYSFTKPYREGKGREGTSLAVCLIRTILSDTLTVESSTKGSRKNLKTEYPILFDHRLHLVNSMRFRFPNLLNGVYSISIKKQSEIRVYSLRNNPDKTHMKFTEMVIYYFYQLGGENIQDHPFDLLSNLGNINGSTFDSLVVHPDRTDSDKINLYVDDSNTHTVRKIFKLFS